MAVKSRAPRQIAVSFVCVLLLTVLFAACGDSNTTSTPTPTPTVQLTNLPLGVPQKALDAPVTGTIPDSQVLHIGVSFKLNEDELKKLGGTGFADKNGNLNSSDIANKLGITDAEIEQMKQFFGIEGATLKFGKLHTSMTIDIKAGTVARLLHTRFVIHKLNGRTYYTVDPKMLPQVPSDLLQYIVAVTGLDNYSLPPKHSISQFKQQAYRYFGSSQANADCNADSQTLGNQDVGNAYSYNKFWDKGYKGKGLTVNLVEIDGFADGDVQNYFSCVGYQGKLNVTSMGGSRLDAGGESTLDIDMIAGLAPQVNIHDYEVDMNSANNGGDSWTLLNDAFQQLINDNSDNTSSGGVVSVSLGGPEAGITSDDLSALDQSFKVLTQVEHMTVLVSSGDCAAYADGTYNDLSVSYPASDPYVTAVGGTELSVDQQGNRSQEIAWSDGTDTSQCNNAWGSGGGVSVVFPKPDWQSANGVSNQYSTGKREVPDISAVAYSLAVYFQGQWISVGGTSAATPIWASGLILSNQALLQSKQKFAYGTGLFYYVANHTASGTPFNDITQGNNLYYQAGTGWDYPTGLGTPNLVDFYNAVEAGIG